MSQEKWDVIYPRWERIHHMRGMLPPGEIIGYEYRDDEEEVSFFVCAYHETAEYFEDYTPVTVKDTWKDYYQCDRMGCEMSYYQEWMQEEKNNEGEEG